MTEPILRIYVEAESPESAEKLARHFSARLEHHLQQVWFALTSQKDDARVFGQCSHNADGT